MNTLTERFEKEQKEFLNFLRGKFNLFHQSNVFFRDIHYGVMAYLEMKNLRTPYAKAEQLTREIVAGLQKKGIFRTIDLQTFTLIYPEFKKPPVKVAPAAPAKPAVASQAAARPAPSAAPETASAVGPS